MHEPTVTVRVMVVVFQIITLDNELLLSVKGIRKVICSGSARRSVWDSPNDNNEAERMIRSTEDQAASYF